MKADVENDSSRTPFPIFGRDLQFSNLKTLFPKLHNLWSKSLCNWSINCSAAVVSYVVNSDAMNYRRVISRTFTTLIPPQLSCTCYSSAWSMLVDKISSAVTREILNNFNIYR